MPEKDIAHRSIGGITMEDDNIVKELFDILAGEGPLTDANSILINPTTLRRVIVHIVVLGHRLTYGKLAEFVGP